jgi:hypothetical protein
MAEPASEQERLYEFFDAAHRNFALQKFTEPS